MLLLCLVSSAQGLDPSRDTSQYIREQWNTDSEFPGGTVHAISQTPDGYLWIATDTGLIRFDGFSFHAIPLSPHSSALNTPILGLATDVHGRLLVRLQGTGLLRQRNRSFESVATGTTPEGSQVTAMWRDENGQVLISDLVWGTVRIGNDRAEEIAYPKVLPGAPVVISLASTPDGRIWLGTLNSGLFVLDKGRATSVGAGLPNRKINCLLPVSNDEIWVGTDDGLLRWKGDSFLQVDLPKSLTNLQVLTLLRDRDGNVWVGTAQGLLRVNTRGATQVEGNDLRGDAGINALFEDREGNIWAGGARGVERIRDSAFVTYSTSSGLATDRNGPVYTDPQNRTWFAPVDGGLYWSRDGVAHAVQGSGLEKDVIYSIAGQKGDIWVGRQHGGLTRLRFESGQLQPETLTERNGLAQNSVYAVYESPAGTVWAGTINGGVSRLKDGQILNFTTAAGLSSNTVYSILESRDGAVWVATPNGLNSWLAGVWKTYSAKDGLPSDNVNCLLEDSAGVLWVGTSNGLASLTSGGVRDLIEAPDALHKQIFGLAEDKDGWLWVATSNRVLRVRLKGLAGTLQDGDVREYGLADGLRSTEAERRNRSLVADSLGRIWFSTSRGISVVDPSHLTGDSPPAIAHLEAISADGRPVDLENSVRIPPAYKRIIFRYVGLSLAVPERIRYRYFLDGFDRNWSEPTTSREAAYTNLSAGSYRFRVMASNSDGIWNGTESETLFEVEPALWQTWWFRLAGLLSLTFLGRLAYRYRVRQVTSRLDMQFQERFSERTRIAGELHDTLLQSVQGLILHFQRARNLLPENPAEAVQRLDGALERAEQAIVEGRNTIHDLRSSAVIDSDLARALTALGQELGPIDGARSAGLKIVVEGAVKPLQPVIRDEIYRIVREALRNAFRHSDAQHIEAEIVYEEKLFHIRIRDDGKGIDATILEHGEPSGHWGLVGMRERATRLGGRLDVWSEHKAGTEVELTVPGAIAYGPSAASTGSRLFRRKAKRKA